MLISLLIAFFVVLPLVALRRRDFRGSSVESVLAADRCVTPLQGAGSLLATILGASAVMGTSGLAFKHGWIALVWLGAGVVGLLLLALLLPRIRFGSSVSLPHLLGLHGGKTIRLVSALVIVPAWVGVLAAQLAAAGRICDAVSPGFFLPMTLAAGVSVISSVWVSGQKGAVRTDVFQAVLILAFLAALFIAVVVGQGFQSQTPVEPLPGWKVLEIFLAVSFPFLVGPDIYTRLITVPAEGRRRTLLYTAAGLALCAVVIVALGVAARGVPGAAQSADGLLVAVAGSVWGDFGRGLAALGLLAVVLSTGTSLVSSATILSVDILGRRSVAAWRAAAWAITACATLVAMWLGGIIPALMWSYTVYTSGVAIPAVFALFLHRPLGTKTVLVCVAGGAVMGVAAQAFAVPFGLPTALIVSLVMVATASWFERYNRPATPGA